MASYYVDSNAADDNGDGSIGSPWKYLSTHTGSLSAGDIVYYRGGEESAQIHAETGEIDLTEDGTSGSPITITVYGDELVELQNANAGEYIFKGDGEHYIIDGKDQLDINKNDDTGACIYVEYGGDDWLIKDCEIHNARWMASMCLVRGNNCTFDGCTIYAAYNGDSNDAAGIRFSRGSNLTVSNCTIYDCCSFQVFVDDEPYYPGPWFVNDCVIYTTLDECSEGGVAAKDADATTQSEITGCTFYGFRACDGSCGGSGVPDGPAILLINTCQNVLVANNTIYDCTSGIAVRDAVSDITIRNNVIYDLVDSDEDTIASMLHAIYLHAADTNVYNNTIYNAPDTIFRFVTSVSGVVIRNNIICDCAGDIIGEGLEGYTADHNCWYNCGETLSGAGDVTDDPSFVNEAGRDFHLAVGSPCIDAGVDVGLSYHGEAPDMGRYESSYSGTAMVAPYHYRLRRV